ncbi:MAG: bifunctional diaminohydroxyphosphoribosylaminopyrimidine deaminase/5-amino-6-(5-phosphoribosylamino)uracil reductase RibD [Coriobacteriia bacterium]|nr:bifunctional diaminohydroxyphosphoribosylaminopyrimidine deaminase/5-amino-6-(5-phosphoribosylamino)uracil reductase RibD [Coriobacteriia bacterium]
MSLFTDDSALIPDPYMRRAYLLAENGRGRTSPNPLVGCVIVRDGAVVGEGFHAQAGGDHAEVVALKAAGGAASGATAYVTLEPCTHFGKTPPCAPALIRAGVREVVVGMRDPNTEVSGKGAEVLAAAGVAVRFFDDPSPFERQNEAWLHRLHTGRPFLTVKCALSLDGKPSVRIGRRTRITGEGGSSVTMRRRARAPAVAVGAATAEVDDPALTYRGPDGTSGARQPLRMILARTSVPRPTLAMLRDGLGPVTLVVSDRADDSALDAFRNAGGTVVSYTYADGLEGALRAVASAGVDDVLVEAGPGLLTALHTAGLVDRFVTVTAGGFAGNAAPPVYLGPPDLRGNDLAHPYRAEECLTVQGDVAVVWVPRPLD